MEMTAEGIRKELERPKGFSEAFAEQLEILKTLTEDQLQKKEEYSQCSLSGESVEPDDIIVFLYVPYNDPDNPTISYESIMAKKEVVERMAEEHGWEFTGGRVPFTHWKEPVKIFR